jgi:dephospho-CoA kinase
MKTVGLTGGFGSGKSTVLAFFKKMGACVLSCDTLVHQELKNNKLLKNKIRRYFGDSVFEKKEVSRVLLGSRVFSSPDDLERLNSLIHPLVKKRILAVVGCARKKNKRAVVVVEVPLLFEAGFDKIFDVTIGIAADLKISQERLLRGFKFTRKDMSLRRGAQLSCDKKIRRCDFVIDNNGSKDQTRDQVKGLMILFKKCTKVN